MQNTIDTLKALADKNRLIIVCALLQHKELCACQLTELLEVTGATASRHLSLLSNAQIIQSRKEGRWVYFRINSNISNQLHTWLLSEINDSVEINDYMEKLKTILSLEPEVICKKQRQ